MSTSLQLSDEDLQALNSRTGLKHLLSSPGPNVANALKKTQHDLQMQELYVEFIHLQNWILRRKQRLVVIFEGRDAAGKGGAIRKLTAHLNPRHYHTYALPAPSEEERGQWYFQRYVACLPNPGEMAFFDRSWYNRAMVEPVNGFCTKDEYTLFMGEVNGFEKMLVTSGMYLIKFYVSISREEQAKRFDLVKKSPLKKWQLTPVDEQAQRLWKQYTAYKKKMLEHTHTETAPWTVIDANDSAAAHQAAMRQILNTLPYEAEGKPLH